MEKLGIKRESVIYPNGPSREELLSPGVALNRDSGLELIEPSYAEELCAIGSHRGDFQSLSFSASYTICIPDGPFHREMPNELSAAN